MIETFNHPLSDKDPKVLGILREEVARQKTFLVMIPSENYASRAVLEAAGTPFTNKYAEGYPGCRYYHGCEAMDAIEELAIERAKKLFHMPCANVQPHSGSQANQAAFLTLLKPQDRFLAMALDQGGHLSHGMKINFSGRFYEPHFYGVDKESETINYEALGELAERVKPKLLLVGASAYPRQIDFERCRRIADAVGAKLLADIAHIAGLVAAGEHPDPAPYADVVTTTTHKTLRGPRSGLILCREDYRKEIDRAVFPGLQGGPLMHVILAKAVCFHEAASEEFRAYQRQIVKNCQVLARTLAAKGLRLVSGGTDNHLCLVDVRPYGLGGQEAADLLQEARITVNKNVIPYDTGTPVKPSGIRLGTPALTSRGMGEAEMEQIGEWISEVLKRKDDAGVRRTVAAEVVKLCERFPIYPFLA